MNMPFGFGGFGSMSNKQKTELTPQQQRKRQTRRLGRSIQGGLNSGDTMGAMMGFMGLPWMSRGSDRLGNYGGPMQWVSANDFLGGFGGFGGGGGNGGNGGNGGGGGGDGGGDGNGNGGGGGGGGVDPALLELLYPPPIGTGAQWRNTMKYGA